jgi:aminoglycoside/choline kinase family phosphotransferase
LIASKATKLVDWSLPWAVGRPATASEREAVAAAFAWIAAECERAPARLAHRDFKAANLHLRLRDVEHDERRDELVMLDLQGAFLAPPEYDLVCLLRDSHVLLPEAEVAWQLTAIRSRLPDRPDPADFTRRFCLLTLTRVGKDISHYLHAAASRGDRRFLQFVPTAVANLKRAAAEASGWHPLLADLAEILSALPSAEPRT